MEWLNSIFILDENLFVHATFGATAHWLGRYRLLVQSRRWSPGRGDLAAWAWCATTLLASKEQGTLLQGRCWGQGDNTDSVGGWDIVTWLVLHSQCTILAVTCNVLCIW